MTTKIDFATFEARIEALKEQLPIVTKLFNEADDLLTSVNTEGLTDEQLDYIDEVGYEIAEEFGAQFDGVGGGGLWMPSTC